MEELRDERLSKIITWMQSWMRGFTSRKGYVKLQEQRVALVVVQRNLRKFQKLQTWAWFNLWQKVKPLLHTTRIEDVMNALKDKAAKAVEDYEGELKLRQELEAVNTSLQEERNNLKQEIESSQGNMSEFLERQAKLQALKQELEVQFNVSTIY